MLNFIIPLKFEDLSAFDSDRYCVEYTYSEQEVNDKLPSCVNNLSQRGCDFILEDFDVFYGVISHFDSLDRKITEKAWKCIVKSADTLLTDLQDILNDSVVDDEISDKRRQCNILKMIMYIYCSMIEKYEEQEAKANNAADAEQVVKGKGKRAKKVEVSHEWERYKEKALDTMMKIAVMPLHRLFTPPVIEEEFINTINHCCYKILENPAIAKKEHVKKSVMNIIANSISKQKQSLSVSMKLLQLLQMKESLVNILVQLVCVVVKDYRQTSFIAELIDEIANLDMTRESSGTRAIAKFLEELAENCSNDVLEVINEGSLLPHLEEDAYIMRNAVLAIIGKVVTKCLSDKNDADSRILRDQLLDILEEHILDITTYTRSKALQVWTRLCEDGLIPVTRLDTLVEAVVGRLRDKSVNVRKNAVLFLTAFLNKNPFAAQISLEKLQVAFITEKEKLRKLLEDANQTENSTIDTSEIWESIEESVKDFWMEISQTSGSAIEDDEDDVLNRTMLSGNNDLETMLSRFRDLLKKEKFSSALKLMKLLEDQFPTCELFDMYDDEMNDSDSDNSLQNEPRVPRTLQLVKKLFLADRKQLALGVDQHMIQRMAKGIVDGTNITSSEENPKETIAINDISKQQVLVKYLEDAVKFAEQIKIAIPLVCSLLFSNSVTDAQEAIDFFVTAYQFGVQGAIIGIRQMLVLIFSREKGVREAVLAAYEEVYLNSSKFAEISYRQREVAIVKSLIELALGATLGEAISLEELLKTLFESNKLGKEHISILFEKYSKKIQGTTDAESQAAAQLLAMLAGYNKAVIRDNLDTFISVGLVDNPTNLQLVQYTCAALQKASCEKQKVEEPEPCFRLEQTHQIFHQLHEILVNNFTDISKEHWLPMADEAIRVIYALAEHPDFICEEIIKDLLEKVLPDVSTGNSPASHASENENSEILLSSDFELLTRFMSLLGNVAFGQLVHMESSIATEIKIRRLLKEKKEAAKSKSISETPRNRKSAPRTPKTPGGDLEDEMGMAGAAAVEDVEAEAIAQICNEELVECKNFITNFKLILTY